MESKNEEMRPREEDLLKAIEYEDKMYNDLVSEAKKKESGLDEEKVKASDGLYRQIARTARNSFLDGIMTIRNEKIDWEKRRYELTKSAMVGILAAPIVEGVDPNPSQETIAKWATSQADAVIRELKKSDF